MIRADLRNATSPVAGASRFYFDRRGIRLAAAVHVLQLSGGILALACGRWSRGQRECLALGLLRGFHHAAVFLLLRDLDILVAAIPGRVRVRTLRARFVLTDRSRD